MRNQVIEIIHMVSEMTTNAYQQQKQMVRKAYEHVLERGAMYIPHGVEEIREALGGTIARAVIKKDKCFTVGNDQNMFSLNYGRGPQKYQRLAEKLALACLREADMRGEAHLGKDASTKDHKEGIEKILRRIPRSKQVA